jgi:prepilin-type N-terminal cleavage/methylation domain-containing protein
MRLTCRRVRDLRRSDDGFTLIELVLSVAILGVVASALCGIMLQYLKTTSDTSARLTESTDQQFISTYWQNDVSSLGQRALVATIIAPTQSVFVGAAYTGGCRIAGSGVVVAFSWNEFAYDVSDAAAAWNTTLQEVSYVTVANGTRLTLRRVRCHGGTVDAPVTVAHNLTATPTIACDTACGSATLPNRVSMTFTVRDPDRPTSPGYTTTVSADRRQG